MAEFLSDHFTYPLAPSSNSLYGSIDPHEHRTKAVLPDKVAPEHAATSAAFHQLKLVTSLAQIHGKKTTQDCECQEALCPVATGQTDCSTLLSDPGWLTSLPYSENSRSRILWQQRPQALRSFI